MLLAGWHRLAALLVAMDSCRLTAFSLTLTLHLTSCALHLNLYIVHPTSYRYGCLDQFDVLNPSWFEIRPFTTVGVHRPNCTRGERACSHCSAAMSNHRFHALC